MMRYQRVRSPDYLPASNGSAGRKTSLRTCKEDESYKGRIPAYSSSPPPPNLDSKSFTPLKPSPASSASQGLHQHHHNSPIYPPPPLPFQADSHAAASTTAADSVAAAHRTLNGHNEFTAPIVGDILLQWGHNKRSRGSRSERQTAAAAASSADDSSPCSRQVIRIHRRSAARGKLAASIMPPPAAAVSASTRGLLPPEPTGPHLRSAEEKPAPSCWPEKRAPPAPPPSEKPHKMAPNGWESSPLHHQHRPDSKLPSDQDTAGSGGSSSGVIVAAATAAVVAEKLNLEQFEWPRIYISLSRKEKEDDFLVMKGTKLPQRPKKRAKNVDKALQCCFPGLWLSDLTRGRYEVREKKCAKKQKRRGLKGMESMDSDSE